jgi:CRISPR-associated endonuclease/helicase Cas3
MTAEQLLAKSGHDGLTSTLAGHTAAVARAARTMFGAPELPTGLSNAWLRFFRLGEGEHTTFARHLLAAAALHDVGKANDGFQRVVRNKGEQVIRHEHLSALLLWQQPAQAWLRAAALDAELIVAAVVSHHLKVSDTDFARQLKVGDAVTLHSFASVLPELAALAGLAWSDPPAALAVDRVWSFTNDIGPAREEFERAMFGFSRRLRGDERRVRLLLAVKAALIAADSAGSAVMRLNTDLEAWLRASFALDALQPEDIHRGVIEPRIEELQRRGRWSGFHDFQKAAEELGPRALLLSGCGSGKTLAAWKWIAAQLRRRPASRVIFLYPTRGTATEGFRDYVSWAGAERASLISGTSRYDLEGLFSNPSDPRLGRDYTTPERLFALGYWRRRIFSGTVDSFLAFINNRYAALCLLPLLADSVIVFDEVHSFDRSMFRSLERFLTFFDVPVLCMTASLPSKRIETLRDICGLEVFPQQPGQFQDLERQTRTPRYRVHRGDRARAELMAREAIAAGKKVLWVANTVARCQAVARRMADEMSGASLLCYHSRFRLHDRRDRHAAVMEAFQSGREPALVVSTQVCEMSLDLDADVLVTEVAAVPSLIQRMGRCCREPIPAAGRIGEVHMYEPEGHLPYSREEVAAGRDFAVALTDEKPISQAELGEYLARLDDEPEMTRGFVGFLDSGWYAMSRDDSFREDDDFAVDCVLDTEVDAYLQTRREGRGQEDGFVLPVPRRAARSDPRLGDFLQVAPASRYDVQLGFVREG